MTVSCGVRTLGDEGPNAPIELGVKSAQWCWRATSSEFIKAPMLTCHAIWGLRSPTADSRATRLKIVSIWCRATTEATAVASRASSTSNGPSAPSALHSRTSVATTLRAP